MVKKVLVPSVMVNVSVLEIAMLGVPPLMVMSPPKSDVLSTSRVLPVCTAPVMSATVKTPASAEMPPLAVKAPVKVEVVPTVRAAAAATVLLAFKVVKEPAAAEAPPMTAPSIVPPLMSPVVTEPRSVQVAPAAVGEVVMIGETKVLVERLSDPARVAKVPVVGRVTLVAAEVVKNKVLAAVPTATTPVTSWKVWVRAKVGSVKVKVV